MIRGIRDQVAIIGMGCTRFGEHWDKNVGDLIVEAFAEALEDAGLEKKDIDAAWYGTCYQEIAAGKSGIRLGTTLKLPFIPITRVENLCVTGSDALRGACYAVAAGAVDIALAIGCEKLKDTGYGGLPGGENLYGTDNRVLFPNASAPGAYSQVANAYFAKYGLSPERGKRGLAHISYKSHKNGALNPKAHLRMVPTMEQIMSAPIMAWPLGLFDCCGVSDGAACAIVCRASRAKEFRKDPVYVKALQVAVSSGDHPRGHPGLRGGRRQSPPGGDQHDGTPRLLLDHGARDLRGPPDLPEGPGRG